MTKSYKMRILGYFRIPEKKKKKKIKATTALKDHSIGGVK